MRSSHLLTKMRLAKLLKVVSSRWWISILAQTKFGRSRMTSNLSQWMGSQCLSVSANKEIFSNQLCSPGPWLAGSPVDKVSLEKVLLWPRWWHFSSQTFLYLGSMFCFSHLSSCFSVFAEIKNLVSSHCSQLKNKSNFHEMTKQSQWK